MPATWFRRRRTPQDRVPPVPCVSAPVAIGGGPSAPGPRVAAVRPRLKRGRTVHHGLLPFGMAVYPDSPPPAEPWFGGPTPAPQRIIPGQRAYDEAGET